MTIDYLTMTYNFFVPVNQLVSALHARPKEFNSLVRLLLTTRADVTMETMITSKAVYGGIRVLLSPLLRWFRRAAAPSEREEHQSRNGNEGVHIVVCLVKE